MNHVLRQLSDLCSDLGLLCEQFPDVPEVAAAETAAHRALETACVTLAGALGETHYLYFRLETLAHDNRDLAETCADVLSVLRGGDPDVVLDAIGLLSSARRAGDDVLMHIDVVAEGDEPPAAPFRSHFAVPVTSDARRPREYLDLDDIRHAADVIGYLASISPTVDGLQGFAEWIREFVALAEVAVQLKPDELQRFLAGAHEANRGES